MTVLYQEQLFDPETESHKPMIEYSKPIKDGIHLSCVGLRYNTYPIVGWVEVKELVLKHNSQRVVILENRAFVDPNTISDIYIQRWGRQFEGRMNPISWGFGPHRKLYRSYYEIVGFVLVTPDDYDWIKPILQEKTA